MGYIILDREGDGGHYSMRQQMRRNMRRNYRIYDGGSDTMMREGEYERGYRMGYRHGVEDWEEDDENYRRSRDSRGRYM